MKASLILQRHNRHGGLCHNSPRLHSVIRNVCIAAGESGGWWHPIHPSDIGLNILRILSVDPADIYNDLPAPQSERGKSYIRADIRFNLIISQQLLFLILILLLLLL